MSSFDDQSGSEPLPIAERRHSDKLAAQERRSNMLMGIAIGLPVLTAMVLLVCLVVPLVRGPRSAAPEVADPPPASAPDWQTRRELQQQQAAERDEEELQAIRLRVDRAVEAKQREAKRREQGRPPRLSDSDTEGYED
jgi:hypothetical protein